MASLQDMASGYGLLSYPGSQMFPPAESAATAPVATAPVAVAPQPQGPEQLLAMLQKYQGGEGTYAAELAAARKKSEAETQAFQDLLKQAMETKTEAGPSKAELYFRLASAFGTPGKTGSFFENLGQAGAVMAQAQKEEREAEREARARRLQFGIQAQQARMAGAKEDLGTLRQLAAEEMKDKRAIASELLKDYVKSGQPQSAAGKQAQDEGLKPGTPEFQKRVGQIAEMNVDRQMAQINATLAGMSVQQANLALAQQKFGFQQEQATKLTAPELKLKIETEDALSNVSGATSTLKRAYDLNKNSMSGSLIDVGKRALMEAAGSKDPLLVNTQELEKLLTEQMISTAAEKMKGVLSDSDIKLLQGVSGAKTKNQEERARIILNNIDALKRGEQRLRKRLNEINQGLYRQTTPTAGGLE